jgi:hypothetical protein
MGVIFLAVFKKKTIDAIYGLAFAVSRAPRTIMHFFSCAVYIS